MIIMTTKRFNFALAGKRGIKAGLNTTWTLGKIIFPISVIITIISYTPLLDYLTKGFTPLMKLIGLPGDAAIPLVLGNVLNLYAAIGAIISLDLTVKDVFILALMLSFSHNLIIETTVAKKIGVNPLIVVGLRLSLAILAAIFVNLLWMGGTEKADFIGVSTSYVQENLLWWQIGYQAIIKALIGIFEIALIVIPLMLFIQILKELKTINYLSIWLRPFTRFLNVSENSAIPLLAGLIFGLVYGAGLIIESAKEEEFSKKDLYLLSLFLVASHAVIEDTLIFIPLGIPVGYLLLIRVTVALLVTTLTAKIWNKLYPRLSKMESTSS